MINDKISTYVYGKNGHKVKHMPYCHSRIRQMEKHPLSLVLPYLDIAPWSTESPKQKIWTPLVRTCNMATYLVNAFETTLDNYAGDISSCGEVNRRL